jgi:hypothetical protein
MSVPDDCPGRVCEACPAPVPDLLYLVLGLIVIVAVIYACS